MKQLFLRRYGAGTITLAVPAEFVQRLELEPGDSCFWNEVEGDEVVLRFAKAVDLNLVPQLMRRHRALQAEQKLAKREPQDAAE
jgi:hypothetical protein